MYVNVLIKKRIDFINYLLQNTYINTLLIYINKLINQNNIVYLEDDYI